MEILNPLGGKKTLCVADAEVRTGSLWPIIVHSHMHVTTWCCSPQGMGLPCMDQTIVSDKIKKLGLFFNSVSNLSELIFVILKPVSCLLNNLNRTGINLKFSFKSHNNDMISTHHSRTKLNYMVCEVKPPMPGNNWSQFVCCSSMLLQHPCWACWVSSGNGPSKQKYQISSQRRGTVGQRQTCSPVSRGKCSWMTR